MRATTVAMTTGRARARTGHDRIRAGRVVALPVAVVLLAACGGGSTGASAPTTPAATPVGTASPHAAASASPTATAPGIVAVTTGGALVLLNRATGAVTRTLVTSRVIGDEISVSPGGSTVYFAVHQGGCLDEIESVPVAGGSPTAITQGQLPAVSPDGTKLAFASEPSMTTDCVPNESNLTAQYKLVVRTLSTGSQTAFPMDPTSEASGLPAPISHLSWAQDSTQIAVSISSVQDNEGWALVDVDTAAASYYLSGTGDTPIPVTGRKAQDSYYREGVFLPSGNLFVSRACCTGEPVRNTSRLMWEVGISGALVHQVAIGYANLEHTSLDVTASGKWLLYLAGNDLYVSHYGNTPTKLTTGLIAAAWR
jgi:WD40-like Beta Propeller Repeat